MRKNLYVIYDTVARECNDPFPSNNDGVAMRHFSTAIAKVPEAQKGEFKLYCVGELDYESMLLEHMQSVREIEMGLHLIEEAADGE